MATIRSTRHGSLASKSCKSKKETHHHFWRSFCLFSRRESDADRGTRAVAAHGTDRVLAEPGLDVLRVAAVAADYAEKRRASDGNVADGALGGKLAAERALGRLEHAVASRAVQIKLKAVVGGRWLFSVFEHLFT